MRVQTYRILEVLYIRRSSSGREQHVRKNIMCGNRLRGRSSGKTWRVLVVI
jgi:hypothetical protein